METAFNGSTLVRSRTACVQKRGQDSFGKKSPDPFSPAVLSLGGLLAPDPHCRWLFEKNNFLHARKSIGSALMTCNRLRQLSNARGIALRSRTYFIDWRNP